MRLGFSHHLMDQMVPAEAEHEQLEDGGVQEGRIFHQPSLVLHHLERLLFIDVSTWRSMNGRTEVTWNPAKQISPVLMTNCPKARTFMILSSASANLRTNL